MPRVVVVGTWISCANNSHLRGSAAAAAAVRAAAESALSAFDAVKGVQGMGILKYLLFYRAAGGNESALVYLT